MRYSNPRSPATESRGSRSEVVLKKVELSHWTDRKKNKEKNAVLQKRRLETTISPTSC